jgi:hypothetical protein
MALTTGGDDTHQLRICSFNVAASKFVVIVMSKAKVIVEAAMRSRRRLSPSSEDERLRYSRLPIPSC